MDKSKDSIEHLDAQPPEVQAAVNPSREISTPDRPEPLNAVSPPQGSPDLVNNTPELTVTPAAIPPQDLSTLENKTVSLEIENLTELSPQGKVSWNGHAIGIVSILGFFGCKVQLIHAVLESYGFKCSVRTVIRCIHRYKFFSYNKKEGQPVNGTKVVTKTYPSKKNSVFTISYVNNKLTLFKHETELFQAYTPLYKQFVCGLDGRELIVELTDGQMQVRVFDHPDPKRNEFLVNRRMVCQQTPEAWNRFDVGLF